MTDSSLPSRNIRMDKDYFQIIFNYASITRT